MACDNEKCLPPTDEEFTFLFSGSEVAQGTDSSPEVQNSDNESTPGIVVLPVQMDTTSIVKSGQMDDIADRGNMLGPKITGNKIDQKIPELYKTQQNPLSNCGGEKETKEGMFWLLIFGFIGGLLALLTPCVFPMLPLTVSFFLKDTKRKGWVNGAIYGVSIIFIYVLIGLFITILAVSYTHLTLTTSDLV